MHRSTHKPCSFETPNGTQLALPMGVQRPGSVLATSRIDHTENMRPKSRALFRKVDPTALQLSPDQCTLASCCPRPRPRCRMNDPVRLTDAYEPASARWRAHEILGKNLVRLADAYEPATAQWRAHGILGKNPVRILTDAHKNPG